MRNLTFLEPLAGWRGVLIADVNLGGTNVQVANVHLATPPVGRMRSLTSALSMFQQSEELHAKEIQRLYAHLAKDRPLIVLGDFNSFSFFCAPMFLKEHGFVDSFAAVNEDADQHGTCDFQYGDNQWSIRIDFIFHTKDLRTRSSRILKSNASDHLPVVSQLNWAK